MRSIRGIAGYVWAAPVSIAALPLAALGLVSGARARVLGGVLEVGGGLLDPLLTRGIPRFPIGAITLGHVVLGASASRLDACRVHERIHVRQYERWGGLFPVLYLGSSLLALLRGRSVYADNAFEREAFGGQQGQVA
jgi:hypothetical protein